MSTSSRRVGRSLPLALVLALLCGGSALAGKNAHTRPQPASQLNAAIGPTTSPAPVVASNDVTGYRARDQVASGKLGKFQGGDGSTIVITASVGVVIIVLLLVLILL